MNEQSINYINALVRKHGTEKESNQVRYSLGVGKHVRVDNGDMKRMDSRNAKNFGRELFECWLNAQFPLRQKPFRFITFRTPEWPNPPLDCCDEDGKSSMKRSERRGLSGLEDVQVNNSLFSCYNKL